MTLLSSAATSNKQITMDNFIISIGREYGAGGRTVAARIGEKLGLPVYDDSLLQEVAKEYGYSPDIFKKVDEKHHLFSLSRLFSTNSWNASNYMGDNMLFQMQCQAIRDIAAKGPCVIVGRCANYVLRDMDNVVSVFLTSSLDIRVERVMRRKNLDRSEARKIIASKDSKREDFYNCYTLGHWGRASEYDLCLDSSVLGIDGTADVIISFAQKAEKHRR